MQEDDPLFLLGFFINLMGVIAISGGCLSGGGKAPGNGHTFFSFHRDQSWVDVTQYLIV